MASIEFFTASCMLADLFGREEIHNPLMSMVTALSFFPLFFLLPIFVYFAKKVNPRCLTALPFCLFGFVSILFLLCWESLLFFSSDLAPKHFLPPHPHPDHHVPPPPCLCPRRRRYAWPFRLTWQHAVCHCRHFSRHRCFGFPLFS